MLPRLYFTSLLFISLYCLMPSSLLGGEIVVDDAEWDKLRDAMSGTDDNPIKKYAIDHPHFLQYRSKGGDTLLHLAVRHNKKQLIERYCNSGLDMNALSSDGYTALYQSLVEEKGFNCLKLLLLKGADPNVPTKKFQDVPLSLAMRIDNFDAVKELLQAGADVNRKVANGNSPFHYACMLGRPNLVREFLAFGANLKGANEKGHTPVHLASEANDSETVSLLLEKGAEINTRDSEGRTPLGHAVHYNCYDAVRILIDRKANLDIPENSGATPLARAISREHSEIALRLLQAGAKWEEETEDKHSTLSCAVVSGLKEVVAALFKAGAKIDKSKQCAFPILVLNNNSLGEAGNRLSIARLLLENGAPVEQEDPLGNTAIYMGKNDPAMIELLLKYGANIEHRNSDGETPLLYNARLGNISACTNLIKFGAKVTARTEDGLTGDLNGRTAIYITAFWPNAKMTSFFIEQGVDVNSADSIGVTPLMVAVQNGNTATVEVLIKAGAKINTQIPSSGLAALHVAAYLYKPELVRLLLANGADVSLKNRDGYTAKDFAIAGDRKENVEEFIAMEKKEQK